MKSATLGFSKNTDLLDPKEKTKQGGLKVMSQVFGGSLLVAGTCIGAGMLGLPVSTAAGGFYWTTSFFLIVWVLMTATAFLMLEASLWHKEDTNLISMIKETLGRPGEVLAWVVYLLFLYSIMAAYTAGGAAIFGDLLKKYGVSQSVSSTVFVLSFGSIVYFGTRWVDFTNRIFMIGLIVAYFCLVFLGAPEVNTKILADGDSKFLWAALPLMVTSFGFHLLIPSLKTYLNNDVRKLRLSLLIGSLIPLFVYLLWEFIILGIIPSSGETGLIAMLDDGQPALDLTRRLSEIVISPYIEPFAKSFTFFALLSSFIGVALGLFDFLADGLRVKKTHQSRIMLAFLTFVPPSIFLWLYPKGFLVALSYAGAFAAILLVIFPALMVYVGRYRLGIKGAYQMIGGKSIPLICILFGVIVIALQVLSQMNLLPLPYPS